MGVIRGGLAGLLLAGGLCGCQCCRLFDHYADAVDCIATKECCFDRLYHPGLDLTRIGRPDWCQCGINRALCPCACARRKPFPHIIEPSPAYYYGAPAQQGGAPAQQGNPPQKSPTVPTEPSQDHLFEDFDATGVQETPEIVSPTFELNPAWPAVEALPAETDRKR